MLMELLGLKPTGNAYADAAIGTVADPLNLILARALLKNRKARGLGREAVGTAEEATLHSMRPPALNARVHDMGPPSGDPRQEAMSQALRYVFHSKDVTDEPGDALIMSLLRKTAVRPEVTMPMTDVQRLARSGSSLEDFVWGPAGHPLSMPTVAPPLHVGSDTVTPAFLDDLAKEWNRVAPRRPDLFNSVKGIVPSTNYMAHPWSGYMRVPVNESIDVHALVHEAQHLSDPAANFSAVSANKLYRAEFPAIFEEVQGMLLEKRFEEAVARNALQSLNRTGLMEAGGMGAWNAPAPFFWGGGENG